GILAAIALPQYQAAVLKSKFSTVIQNVKTLKDAEEVFFLINGYYTDDLTLLDAGITNCSVESITGMGTGATTVFICANDTAYRFQKQPAFNLYEIVGLYAPQQPLKAWGRITYRQPLDIQPDGKPLSTTPASKRSRCRINNTSDTAAAKVCDGLGRKAAANDWMWE
ncbi:MAG: hypothetical protein LBL61_00080, partial [Elusimicrobiota bacterium]|nr:hypothetical protein [Elusimicrobiota bacterium]